MRDRWARIFDRSLARTGRKELAIAVADRRTGREHYVETANREARSLIDLSLIGRRDLEEVLLDHQFWADQKVMVLRRMEPLMRVVFDEGIAFAKTIDLAKGVGRRDAIEPEPAALEDLAAQIFRTYTDDWWNGLQKTTQDALRQAIITASQDGTGMPGIIKAIAPLFGQTRARVIGVTETTRLFGRGAQATYQASGLQYWDWFTVQDDRVCEICDALQGKRFLSSVPFNPAHPNCRCFPAPAA